MKQFRGKNYYSDTPLVDMLIDDAIYFLCISGDKVKVIKNKNSVNGIIINPTEEEVINPKPQITINNTMQLENIMEEYINTVYETDILYTKKSDTFNIRYCLSRVWANATNYDFDNPDKLYQRYISFIRDDTFIDYSDKCFLGCLKNNNRVYAQRIEEENYYETPYTLRFFFQRDNYSFSLPVIRYAIETDNKGQKIAYIYAIQRLSNSDSQTPYEEEINNMMKQINSGVKENRGVSPSAIIAFSLFIGMLHREGIKDIKVVDFLYGRWNSKFSCLMYAEEELDKLQYNLTNKFLTNFLRISNSFDNFTITAFPNDIDSFLHVATLIPCHSSDPLLEELYELGLKKDNPVIKK